MSDESCSITIHVKHTARNYNSMPSLIWMDNGWRRIPRFKLWCAELEILLINKKRWHAQTLSTSSTALSVAARLLEIIDWFRTMGKEGITRGTEIPAPWTPCSFSFIPSWPAPMAFLWRPTSKQKDACVRPLPDTGSGTRHRLPRILDSSRLGCASHL